MTVARRVFAVALVAVAAFAVWLVEIPTHHRTSGIRSVDDVSRETPRVWPPVEPVGDETLIAATDAHRWTLAVEHAERLEAERLAREQAEAAERAERERVERERQASERARQQRQQAAAPAPAPPINPPAAAPVSSGSVWDRLAQCESGGNWHINSGNGYYGGLQFSLQSWRGVGGTGYPHEHSRGHQIAMGERLRAVQGWGAWPGCSARLGLR